MAARQLIFSGLREQIQRTRVSPTDRAFRDYLRLILGKAASERLHATFVDADDDYLGDEILAEGGLCHVDGDLRHLLARAFDLGAQGVILAHNHPSGSAEPSAEDIALTRHIATVARSVDLRLIDHLVVGGGEIVSMHERDLL